MAVPRSSSNRESGDLIAVATMALVGGVILGLVLPNWFGGGFVIDEPMGAFLGACVGLIGVAVAAIISVNGLILVERQKNTKSRQELASSIVPELLRTEELVSNGLASRKFVLLLLKGFFDKIGDDERREHVRSLTRPIETPSYDKHYSELGVLGSKLATKVSEYFEALKSRERLGSDIAQLMFSPAFTLDRVQQFLDARDQSILVLASELREALQEVLQEEIPPISANNQMASIIEALETEAEPNPSLSA